MSPKNIKKLNAQTLQIEWDDGHVSVYNLKELRKNCPCANCNEARRKQDAGDDNPFKILTPAEALPDKLTILEAHVVGRYAIRFIWSDGHAEGIYPFELLRSLCECELCKK